MKQFLLVLIAIFSISVFSTSAAGLKCPLCNGSGQVVAGGKAIACPVCKGNGNVSSERYNEVTVRHTCKMCMGSGNIAGSVCAVCQGSGISSDLQVFAWLSDRSTPPTPGRVPNPDDNRCAYCKGLGRCPTCKGQGYTTGYGLDMNPCHYCWHPGNNSHYGDGKCSHCHGTGKSR